MSLPLEIENRLPDIRREIADLGAELVDLLFKRFGAKCILTVVADKEGGITLDDCTAINQRLGHLFDEWGQADTAHSPIAGSYLLEVVSPGIDRPLKTQKDFSKALDEMIKLTFHRENGEIATWTARLAGVDEKGIEVQLKDGNRVHLAYEQIVKAVREIIWNNKN